MRSRIFALTLSLGALLAPSAVRASDDPPARPHLIVVQPGFPGSPEAARPFMARLAREIGDRAEIAGLTASYHNEPDDAARAVAALRERAGEGDLWGIVSLGFYLEHRRAQGLTAIAELLPEDRRILVAPKGAVASAASLAGEAVVGGALYEHEFLTRVAFADVEGVAQWKAATTLRISRAIRKLDRGTYAAAVLTASELRTLEKLGTMESLEVVARSPAFPSALLVHFGKPRAEEEPPADGSSAASGDGDDAGADEAAGDDGLPRDTAKRLVVTFDELSRTEEGRELLEDMSCEGVRAARPAWLEKMERKYDEATE